MSSNNDYHIFAISQIGMPAGKQANINRTCAALHHMGKLKRIAQKAIETGQHISMPFNYVRFPLIGQFHRGAQIWAIK